MDPQVLAASDKVTHHKDLGETTWYAVHAGDRTRPNAPPGSSPRHPSAPPSCKGRIAFAWRAMDAFYEEDERILGHAADPYHRIDIRNTSRPLEVRLGDTVVARSEHDPSCSTNPDLPRAGTSPRADIDETRLRPRPRTDLLPLQGPVRLLRHRRCAQPGRLDVPQRLPGGRPDR